ncbi:uncharacterized protein [Primulina eburnea]|uniref:uncharacterized protein n=1 Tax=Primulina eburnea TaxID=1245227 RepID=UPI003C6CB72C
MIAEGWIKSIEVIFDFMELTDADRVRCATFLLSGDAILWWESASVAVNLHTLTWIGFKELFFVKYFTEEAKMRHFMDGLRPILRRDVRVAGPTTYAIAVSRALATEQDLRDIEADRQGKCFKCGASDHMLKECPQWKQPTQGRVFVVHAQEANPDTTLLTGSIFIKRIATQALIDSGATHSFISETFASHLDIKTIGLDVNYSVTVPSGEELLATRVVRDIDLELHGHLVLVSKVLRYLLERFNIKICAIDESKDTSALNLEDLISSLRTFEMNLDIQKRDKRDDIASYQ